jgi:shikimate kinase
MSGAEARDLSDTAGRAAARLPGRSLVLVGLMGAGKSCIGRKLAARLVLPFVDADQEIEKAAGLTIEEIFANYGETAFRAGERRVIQRLLEGPVQVLATGGGAYMDPLTRRRIAEKGIAIWLKADLDLLVRRTARKGNRPLLKNGEPREVLARLMEQRYPVYAEADLTVDSSDAPPDTLVERILAELDRRGQLTATSP